MKYDIFISYSRDDKSLVHPFVEYINRAISRNCWIDLKGIESGEEFEDVIMKAIDECQVVLFMLSDNSLKSKWTKREVYYAEKHKKRIVPVVVDGNGLRGWFDFHFGNIDYVSIYSEEQKTKLVENLRTWLGLEESILNKAKREQSGNEEISMSKHGTGEDPIKKVKDLHEKIIGLYQRPILNSAMTDGIVKLMKNRKALWLMVILFILIGGGLMVLCNEGNTKDNMQLIYDDKCQPVDLGLTSGTLWGDRNLGAKEIADYGYYYAWGMEDSIISQTRSDNLPLEFQDAASKHLGNHWKTPTKEQVQELIDSCDWTIDSINGHKGYRVSSPKDSSKFIFLPAGGVLLERGHQRVNRSAYYWTSDSELQNDSAYDMHFFVGNNYVNESDCAPKLELAPKTVGRLIRAVYIKN